MKFGIIGAGPSGLTMGLFIKYPYEILEKSNEPGGHAGSFIDQKYTFDYGPHIMFSKNKEVLNFMIRSLKGNVHKCLRNNKISFKNSLIRYPFENDLKSLPLEDNYECLYTFLFNPYKKKYSKPKNLEQWLLKNFGKGICKHYLFPYNRKVWNIPVKKLSMIWVGRIPNPPAEDIIKSSIGFKTEGYLHQLYYYYPLKGGYQALSRAWEKKENIAYNFEVKNIIKTSKNTFRVSNGNIIKEYDRLISTMPIHELIKIINIPIPQGIRDAIKQLIVNPMFIISLGLKGEDRNKYTALYFPEKEFLVNRVSFPKTFSPHNAPDGHYSIQAEITCRKNSVIWKKSNHEIANHVVDGLLKRGIIPNKKMVVYKNVRRAEYAYVVYDLLYEKNTKIIRDWFKKQGIYLVGRFSFFEYINVDGVIIRSKEIAEEINGQSIDLSKLQI